MQYVYNDLIMKISGAKFIITLAIITVSCINNSAPREFEFKKDTVDYEKGKIENLDKKNGFQNLKLNSSLNDIRFGENWHKWVSTDQFDFYSITKPKTTIGDLPVNNIKLTFYCKRLISIDIIISVDTVNVPLENEKSEKYQDLALLLTILYGEPNNLGFTYCKFIAAAVVHDNYVYPLDKIVDLPDPTFLYFLIEETDGMDLQNYELTGAMWKGQNAELEYYRYLQKYRNNRTNEIKYTITQRYRTFTADYYPLSYNYFLDNKRKKQLQDSTDQSFKRKATIDSLNRAEDLLKGRFKGL
jgi:hypothetical protein